MKPARSSPQHLGKYRGLTDLGSRLAMNTNLPIKDELFSLIEYISEIESNGTLHIENIGHRKEISHDVFLRFKSFIRQAKSFYEATDKLSYRSSSLLFYYSFLNLAKSYSILIKPDLFLGTTDIVHGLSFKFTNADLTTHELCVTEDDKNHLGAFGIFYESFYQKKIPNNFKLNIVELLGYVTDITYQYEAAGYGLRKILPAKYKIICDIERKKSWPLMAIATYEKIEEYIPDISDFNSYFEEVDLEKENAWSLFEIPAEEKKFFRFFESIEEINFVGNGEKIDIGKIHKDSYKVLKNIFSINPYEDGSDFFLNVPLKNGNTILPFNEPVAIYCVMFYLSYLVRYQPYYLEKLLNSKDAWMIENFVKSAPLTFLRHLTSQISMKDFILIRR